VHRLHLLQRHLRPLLLLLLRSLALGNHLLHGHLLLVLPALLLERLLLRLEGRLGTARGRRSGAHEVLGSHQTARGGLNVRAHVAICDLHRRREEPAELLILGARDVHLLDRRGEGVIVLHFATELAEHAVVRGGRRRRSRRRPCRLRLRRRSHFACAIKKKRGNGTQDRVRERGFRSIEDAGKRGIGRGDAASTRGSHRRKRGRR
jgi:hypothetical protein